MNMTTETAPQKLWNFSYIYLLCLSAITALAFNMITPTLPKYTVSLGASLPVAGFISGIFSITALVVRPVSGIIADRLNKKWIMVIATSFIGIAVLGYTLSSSVPVVFVFRVIHGVAFAISGTTNIAFGSSFIPNNRLGEGIGYLGLGQILASAVGPNLGLSIAENYGYNMCFLVSFGIVVVAAVLMLGIRYTHKTKVPTERKKLKFSDLLAVELIPLAALGGLFSLGNGLVSTFIAMLGDERGIANVGIFFTVSAITLLLVRPFAGKLNDRKGIGFVLYPAYILAALAMVLIGGANALWMIALAGFLKAVGQGAGQPAIQTECIRKLGRERSGIATSTYFIGADIGQGFGPIIAGAVTAAFGYSTMYYGAAALIILGLVFFHFYRKR